MDVPSVDPDAPLEIEKIIKTPEVPEIDKNASLKVEDVEEEEEEEPQEKSNKKLFIIGGIILGAIILATIGFFVFSSGESQQEKIVSPQAESSPTPTEASKQTLNRSDWSLEVLNGSGVAGVAKKAADKLIELGYRVVKTGNADKQTYEENQFLVSKEMEDKADLVVADLKDTVKIATVSATLKDSTASARIIIGKEGLNP